MAICPRKSKSCSFQLSWGGGYGEWEGEEEKLLQYRPEEAGLQLLAPGVSLPPQVWAGVSLQGPQPLLPPAPPPPPLLLLPPPKKAFLSSAACRRGPPRQLPGSTASVASKVYLPERLDPILQEKRCLSTLLRASSLPGARALGRSVCLSGAVCGCAKGRKSECVDGKCECEYERAGRNGIGVGGLRSQMNGLSWNAGEEREPRAREGLGKGMPVTPGQARHDER